MPRARNEKWFEWADRRWGGPPSRNVPYYLAVITPTIKVLVTDESRVYLHERIIHESDFRALFHGSLIQNPSSAEWIVPFVGNPQRDGDHGASRAKGPRLRDFSSKHLWRAYLEVRSIVLPLHTFSSYKGSLPVIFQKVWHGFEE